MSTDNSRVLKKSCDFLHKICPLSFFVGIVYILFVFQKVLGVEGTAKS